MEDDFDENFDGELYSTGFMQTGIHEYQFAIFAFSIMEEPRIILKEYFTMRTFKTNNVIVTSVSELCRWLQKDDVSIVELVPTKGIDNEDVIKINFVRKEKEES